MFNKTIIEKNEYRLPHAPTECTQEAPCVAILLATYNGEKYLKQQLDSIHQQTHTNWLIVVSDDGSNDKTFEILNSYQQTLGASRFVMIKGPGNGFADNFMTLVSNQSIKADYFAFSDQDDFWHPTRLQRALQWLQSIDQSQPALYCGRTHLIDKHGADIGHSPVFSRTPSFKNALVQSLAGGNTMVFNLTARELLAQTGRLQIVSHDWWTYMLISGAGGCIRYDVEPSVDYRQHGSNLVGANSRMIDRIYRLKRMFAGHFKLWNDANVEALTQCQHLLSHEHQLTLQQFSKARKSNLFQRCRGVFKSGVYRQTTPGNLGLIAATLLGKI